MKNLFEIPLVYFFYNVTMNKRLKNQKSVGFFKIGSICILKVKCRFVFTNIHQSFGQTQNIEQDSLNK